MQLLLSRNNLIALDACVHGIRLLERNGLIDLVITNDEVESLLNTSSNVAFLKKVFQCGFSCDEQGRVISYNNDLDEVDVTYHDDGRIELSIQNIEWSRVYYPETNSYMQIDVVDGNGVYNYDYNIYGHFKVYEFGLFEVTLDDDGECNVYYNKNIVHNINEKILLTDIRLVGDVLCINGIKITLDETNRVVKVYHDDAELTHIQFDERDNMIALNRVIAGTNTVRSKYRYIFKDDKLMYTEYKNQHGVVKTLVLDKFWSNREK